MSIYLSPRSSGTPANPTRQQLDELDALLQRMLDLPVNKLDPADAPEPTPGETPPPVSYTTPDDANGPAGDEPATPKIDFQALKQRLAAQPELAPDLQASAPAAAAAAQAETGAKDEDWVPLSSTWQPSSVTWKPLARSWQQLPADNPATDDGTAPASADAGTHANELPASVPTPASEPVPAITDAYKTRTEARKPLPALAEPADGEPIAWWTAPLVWVNECFDRGLTPLGPLGRVLRSPTVRLALGVLGLACLVSAAVVLVIDWFGWTS